LGKGFAEYIQSANADLIALQETKINEPLEEIQQLGYDVEWNFAQRRGYSGTAILYKRKPLRAACGLCDSNFDTEGRIVILEYSAFYFVSVYVPNTQGGLERWYYRLDWDALFLSYLEQLSARKSVIIGGDFNVAHDFIDISPEKLKSKTPHGFLSEERDGFNALLNSGLTDVFRELNPKQEQAYSCWSNRHNKRSENQGWRIDYFLVSDCLLPKVRNCVIRADIFGSDHAPVEMEIDI